jgi:hypothetical protein
MSLVGGGTMIERDEERLEREMQLMRYRALAEDVTDPLAARLIRDIIDELELALRPTTNADKTCL